MVAKRLSKNDTPRKTFKSKLNTSNSTASLPLHVAIMPKSTHKKGNGSRSTPYSPASAAKAKAANNIFKMNTDLGYPPHSTSPPSQKPNTNPQSTYPQESRRCRRNRLKSLPKTLRHRPRSRARNRKPNNPHPLRCSKKCIAVEMGPCMAAELTKRVQGTLQQKKLEVILEM